jgi:ribosomal protein S4
VHGHVSVGERIITVPGYEVGGQDEGTIALIGGTAQTAQPPEKAEESQQAPAQQ